MSTNFTPARPGQQTAGYRFKEVDQYVLPKVGIRLWMANPLQQHLDIDMGLKNKSN